MWLIIPIIIIILLLFIKIKITAHGTYEEKTTSFYITVTTLKIIKKTIRLYPPRPKKKAKQKPKLHLKNLRHLYPLMKKLFKHVTIQHFSWDTILGLDDPAETGTITGFLWAFKGMFVGFLNNFFLVKNPIQINVQPTFQEKIIKTELKTTISFRLFIIIIYAIPIWRKIKKSSKTTEKHR